MEQPTLQNSSSAPEVLVTDKPVQEKQVAELSSSLQTQGEAASKEVVTAPETSEKKPEEPSNELVGDSIPSNELGLKVLWPPADSPDADKVDVE
jgi:hypothetical protein